MIKYNYKSAATLWDAFFLIACDPWTFSPEEKQKARREFMRAVTRDDVQQYLDFLAELRDEARPVEDAKSRCYNLTYERQIEVLMDIIKRGVKNDR